MRIEHWLGITQIVITLLGMWFAPRIAVQLSLRQFRSQKWWERLSLSYDGLLRSLSYIYWYASKHEELLHQNVHWKPGDDVKEKYSAALHEIRLKYYGERYLLSEASIEALRCFFEETDLESIEDMSDFEYFQEYGRAAYKCTKVIGQEAKRELLRAS